MTTLEKIYLVTLIFACAASPASAEALDCPKDHTCIATPHRVLRIPNVYLLHKPSGVSADGRWAAFMFEMPGGTPLAEVKWEDTNFSDVGSGPRLSSNPSLVDVSLCLIEDEGVDGCPESPAKVVIFNAQRNHTIAAGKRLLSGKSGKVEEADQIFAPLTNQFFGRGGGIDQPFTFVASCDDATDDAPPERLSLCKVEVEFPEAELSGRLIVRRLGSQYMLEAAKEIASMLDHWERRGG